MSSVSSSSDKKAYNESVKKNQNKKVDEKNEIAAKHRRELRNLSEKYAKEMEDLKNQHQQEVTNLKNRANESMNKRDKRNNEDISDLRSLHRQQLEKAAKENEARLDALRNQYEAENKNYKKSAEKQIESKEKTLEKITNENNKRFTEYSDTMREGMKQGLDNQREKIEAKYNKETKLLTDDRDTQLASAQEAYRNMRVDKNAEIARLDQLKRSQKEDLAEDYLVQVEAERSRHAEDIENRRNVYKESVDQLRERYRKSLEQEKVENAESQGGFKRGVEGRLGEQVKNLERKINQMKMDHAATEFELKKNYEKQKQNLKNAFQLNVEDFEKQRDNSVDMYKEVAHKDIEKARKDFDRTLKLNNNYFKGELENLKSRGEESNTQKNEEYNRMRDHLTSQMNKRVSVVTTGLQQENKKSRDYYNDSMEQMKVEQGETLASIREVHNKDKKEVIGNLRENLRKTSMKSNEELVSTKIELEKKLQSIADENERKLRALRWESDRLLKEQKKESKTTLEMKEQQYMNKISQMQEEYKKNIDAINKNHQNEVTKLIVGQKKV